MGPLVRWSLGWRALSFAAAAFYKIPSFHPPAYRKEEMARFSFGGFKSKSNGRGVHFHVLHRYKETKDETLEQLVEFQESLAKATNGDMSLVNAFGAIQLAIQATVSSAFKNPEVIRMMGKREPGQLRDRIGDLDAKVAIGEITEDARNGQVVEILTAIRKLGGKISAEESAFLESNGSDELNQFEAVSSSLAGEDALKLAGAGVSAAN